MIPILPLLQRIPWRLVFWVSVVLVVFGLGWKAGRSPVPGLKQELAAERACEPGTTCADRAARVVAAMEEKAREQAEITAEVVDRYEQELADLRSRPVPRRVIRVCPEVAADHLRDAASAGRTGQGSPSPGVVHRAVEFDTGPLRELTGVADELSARCRALLMRDRHLAGQN